MLCTKCSKEFDEGILVCDICGEALGERDECNVKYLLTVSNETEKAIVEEILKDADIAIVEKNNMPFGSIIGAMPLGFDIYVREEDWKLAREILESDDFEDEGIEEFSNENEKEEKKIASDTVTYNLRIIAGFILVLVLACIACRILY